MLTSFQQITNRLSELSQDGYIEALQSQLTRIKMELKAERARRKDVECQLDQVVQQVQYQSEESRKIRNELNKLRKEVSKVDQIRVQKEELEKILATKLEDHLDEVVHLIVSRMGNKDFFKEENNLYQLLKPKFPILRDEKLDSEKRKKKSGN